MAESDLARAFDAVSECFLLPDVPVHLAGAVDAGRECVLLNQHVPVRLSFAEQIESLIIFGRKEEFIIPLADVLYAKMTAVQTMEFASMSVPSCRQAGSACCMPKARKTHRQLFTFTLKGDNVSRVCAAMNRHCFRDVTSVKALVVINPVAGKGSAKRDWERDVRPLLVASERFEFESVFTTHKGHAEEIGRDFCHGFLAVEGDAKVFLIVLGGDGIVYELLNGIKAAAGDEKYLNLLAKTVIAPLPSGSGNGLCYSSLLAAKEAFTLNSALLMLLRQRCLSKDLGLIDFDSGFEREQRLFALTISWGLVADVDINSEFLRRPLGDARFTAYGLMRVMKKPLYAGSITFGDNQVEIEPDYVTVYATLVPVAGRTVILNPSKATNDGQLEIYRLRGRDISRIGLMRAMDELALSRNHELRINGFDPIRTSQFQLTPALHEIRSDSAGIVVDGEPLTSAAISVRILPAATNLIALVHS